VSGLLLLFCVGGRVGPGIGSETTGRSEETCALGKAMPNEATPSGAIAAAPNEESLSSALEGVEGSSESDCARLARMALKMLACRLKEKLNEGEMSMNVFTFTGARNANVFMFTENSKPDEALWPDGEINANVFAFVSAARTTAERFNGTGTGSDPRSDPCPWS